ncbi:MAG: homocysteine S-methyltransferase family protein [Bryobacteraceae bacterium]
MNPADFLQRRWVTDGAMATYLFSKGAPRDRPVEELNLTNPALVAEVHREYLEAGAQILRTNTFTANATNQAGVRIAREAAEGRALVAGVIGSRIDGDRAHFRHHAADLAGVDLFILETFRAIEELQAAVAGVREVAGHGIPLIAQLSVDPDGHFPEGLQDLDADVIGFNCSFGPESIWHAFQRIHTAKPLSAVPNAGFKSILSPEHMADYARRFLDAGALVIGACCGSTPDHIRQIRAAADEHATLVPQWPPT